MQEPWNGANEANFNNAAAPEKSDFHKSGEHPVNARGYLIKNDVQVERTREGKGIFMGENGASL